MDAIGKLAGCGLALALAVGSPAGAAVVFKVDQTVGSGSVAGTIETDGATGTLAPADIIGWHLTVTGPGASVTLDSGASSLLFGNSGDTLNPTAGNSDVTADAHSLYFNFDGKDQGYLAFQQSGYSGSGYWCNATSGETYECEPGKSIVPQKYTAPSAQFDAAASGDQVIGVAAVPEPATWSLFLLGVFGLGALARHDRRRRLVAA